MNTPKCMQLMISWFFDNKWNFTLKKQSLNANKYATLPKLNISRLTFQVRTSKPNTSVAHTRKIAVFQILGVVRGSGKGKYSYVGDVPVFSEGKYSSVKSVKSVILESFVKIVSFFSQIL